MTLVLRGCVAVCVAMCCNVLQFALQCVAVHKCPQESGGGVRLWIPLLTPLLTLPLTLLLLMTVVKTKGRLEIKGVTQEEEEKRKEEEKTNKEARMT